MHLEVSSKMETIITNPGLQHLAEKIFWNLEIEHLNICGLINQTCNQILENPMFWLKKFRNLSNDNLRDWSKVIHSVKDSEKRNFIISYLKWNLKKDIVDLQCYQKISVQDDFRKKILKCCQKEETSHEDTEIVKILAPLTDNLNAPDGDGYTPIYNAANNGHTEIVKFLAQLTGIPNPPNENEDRGTPIFKASFLGHTEIVKFLAPLTNNPNAPDELGITPIYVAAKEGHSKIVEFLSHLTDNPNAPDRDGKTPSSVTKSEQIRKFLESFDTSRKRKAGLSKWTSKKKTKKF